MKKIHDCAITESDNETAYSLINPKPKKNNIRSVIIKLIELFNKDIFPLSIL